MSRRRKQGLGSITEINVTPLSDLTFLLLITFIITAPVLEYTINVNPPPMNTEQSPKDVPHKIVSVDRTGQMFLEEVRMTPEQMQHALTAAVAGNAELQVFIRGDEACSYGQMVKVMRTIKAAGVRDFSLLTREEDR
jgi:biopolymer transport protein TolR